MVDLVHMVAYLHGEDASGHDESVPIPDDLQPLADEYHDKLMDVVAETSDELMERYLEGGEITREEMAMALKQLVTEGQVFPVGCGAATRNIGSHGLLDLIVEGLPSPARARNVPETGGANTLAYIFKTIADPYSGRINLMRVYAGTLKGDSQLVNSRTHGKERVGQLLMLQGKDHTPTDELGAGHDRRGREAEGDQHRRRAGRRRQAGRRGADRAAGAGRVVRDRGPQQGRRGQGARLAAAPAGGGPVAGRAPRRGDRRDDRRRALPDARGDGAGAHAPAVRGRGRPEAAARALPRDDPQAGPRPWTPQEADRRPRPVRRLPHRDRADGGARGLRVHRQDRGRRDPAGIPPGRRQGHPGGDAQGRAGGRSRRGRPGAARGRLLPQRRLVGDGVQDRGLDGVQAGGGVSRPGAAGADHAARHRRARRRTWAT